MASGCSQARVAESQGNRGLVGRVVQSRCLPPRRLLLSRPRRIHHRFAILHLLEFQLMKRRKLILPLTTTGEDTSVSPPFSYVSSSGSCSCPFSSPSTFSSIVSSGVVWSSYSGTGLYFGRMESRVSSESDKFDDELMILYLELACK